MQNRHWRELTPRVRRSDADDEWTFTDLLHYVDDQAMAWEEDDTRTYEAWLDAVYCPAKESLLDVCVELGLLADDGDD
jgi:hypothetical protein